ncbi:hypothetical protein H5410_027822, partial [Solanum commersonii]
GSPSWAEPHVDPLLRPSVYWYWFCDLPLGQATHGWLYNSAGGSFDKVNRFRRITWQLVVLLFHRRFMIAFKIFTFWTIGWYSTTSRKYLAKSQLLVLSVFFIFFLQGFAYWNKVRSESIQRIAKCAWRCSGFRFFVLFSLFVPFCA